MVEVGYVCFWKAAWTKPHVLRHVCGPGTLLFFCPHTSPFISGVCNILLIETHWPGYLNFALKHVSRVKSMGVSGETHRSLWIWPAPHRWGPSGRGEPRARPGRPCLSLFEWTCEKTDNRHRTHVRGVRAKCSIMWPLVLFPCMSDYSV